MEALDWKKKIIIIIRRRRIVGFLDFGIWGGMLGQQFQKKKMKKKKKRRMNIRLLSEKKKINLTLRAEGWKSSGIN